MAALASGIFSHAMTAGKALSGSSANPLASPATGTSDTSSTSSTDSSMISANDFLTLLVTEMQNRTPPRHRSNEYINQLVNVNSLEQLININQTLTTDLPSPSTSSASSASTQSAAAASNPAGSNAIGASAQASAPKGGVLATAQTASSSAGAAGDLSSAIFRAQARSRHLSVPNALPAAKPWPTHWTDEPARNQGIGIAEILPSRLPAGRIGPPT